MPENFDYLIEKKIIFENESLPKLKFNFDDINEVRANLEQLEEKGDYILGAHIDGEGYYWFNKYFNS